MPRPCSPLVWLALACGLLAPVAASSQAHVPTLTVFAAADLGPALRQLIPLFEHTSNAKVVLVPGSTGILSQQIRNGAPADLLFAANESAIDGLIHDGEFQREPVVLSQTRTIYARGRLVLLTLQSSAVRLNALSDLANPQVRRVAIANPAHAPYGLAAQQALQAAGVWAAVQPRLVYGENVQQALQFVQSGSADAGLVARSLADSPDLKWTLVEESLHAPLNQTAVVVARSTQPRLAQSFIDFVKGAGGRQVMQRFGFLLPGRDF
jgi:molybdate transport system substrate-binding protein